MVDDTFVFDLKNLTAALFDIIGVRVFDMDSEHEISTIENGVVNYDYDPVMFIVDVVNNGEQVASKDVVIYSDEMVEIERVNIMIIPGATQNIPFNHSGAGFNNPDGEQTGFIVKVE